MLARILIVDSVPAWATDAIVQHGGALYADNYAAALRSASANLLSDMVFHVLAAGNGDSLPPGIALSDFHGIVWTGSPFNAYDMVPVVRNLIDFARVAFDSGVPGFGSCWGMQVMSAALGGNVRLHPRGPEITIARHIQVNSAGQSHAMFQNRPAVFDSLCWHQDEVDEAPPEAVILAGNSHSAIQAIACDTGGRSFWGVQYHPEFDLRQVAALISLQRSRMEQHGFLQRAEDADSLADDLRTLCQNPQRKDIAWRYGITTSVTDAAQHTRELANWLRIKVVPKTTFA